MTQLDSANDEGETVTVAVTVASEKSPVKPQPEVKRETSKQRRREPRRSSSFLRATPQSHHRPTFLEVYDSANKEIHVGDTVQFLSAGKFKSKTGIVYKVTDNL